MFSTRAKALVGLVDDALDQLMDLGELRQRLVVGVGQGLVARPAADIVEVDLDDGAEILPASPTTMASLMNSLSFSAFSISDGAMFLPPEVMMIAFLRSTTAISPLSMTSTMSPVRSQPSGSSVARRRVLVEEIAFEDAGIPQQDFPVAVLLPFGVLQGQAAAAEAVMAPVWM